MAIAEPATEPKIIQYVSMLKWASVNIKDKWSSLHESLIAAKTGKCFAKGSGLRNGIAGRRSKFTIIISGSCQLFEPHPVKTCVRGIRLVTTQICLCSNIK